MQSFRTLDHNGTGTLPRAVFENVMREVCKSSPAWLESLDFAMALLDGDEVNYSDFFDWVYGGSGDGDSEAAPKEQQQAAARPCGRAAGAPDRRGDRGPEHGAHGSRRGEPYSE